MAGDPRDRRAHQRAELVLKLAYKDPSDLLDDYITELGGGGIRIHTVHPLELGQRIAFSLSFPSLLEPLDLEGIVRWRSAPPRAGTEPPSVGVEFVDVDETVSRRLAEILATLRTRGKAPEQVQQPFRVLMVDDNDFVQELFQYAVKRYHAERNAQSALKLFTVGDGRAALDVLDNNEIDLAIIDHYLPGMTGCELVQRIRGDSRFENTAVLVVSVAGDEIREKALRVGADLYLHKPVMVKELLRTLEILVAKRSAAGS